MVVLRLLGTAFLALCAFAGAFLLAYAAILGMWIAYADYSGALGSTDGSDAAFALFWAPLGALAIAVLAAGSVIRMHGERRLPRKRADTTSPVPNPAGQPDEPDADLERRLGEHAGLLEQLRAMSIQASEAPRTAGSISRKHAPPVGQDQRRVA